MRDDQIESTRWKEEAAFFDQEAEAAMSRIQPVHPRTIERYGRLKRRRFNKEFRFGVIGPLAGKSVLDVGCGDGVNAVNFAKLGARVTGIDISPKAIELAQRRAVVDQVSDSVRLVCSPLELAELEPASFDVIWGEAVLHHLIHDLDDVICRLMRWAKPGAVVVFGEPVNLSPALRRLRMMLPIHTDVTPDERPLEEAELDILARYLPDMRVRYFSVLDRLSRFVLVDHNYELSSAPRRGLSNVMNAVDYGLLSMPALRRLAGTCVIYGHAPAAKG
jgi:2-polyprenyl-3-methyl-5-hydroxy-6-metoxy-1,4-benzoquinol methylase